MAVFINLEPGTYNFTIGATGYRQFLGTAEYLGSRAAKLVNLDKLDIPSEGEGEGEGEGPTPICGAMDRRRTHLRRRG